jgi:hypothetical protein
MERPGVRTIACANAGHATQVAAKRGKPLLGDLAVADAADSLTSVLDDDRQAIDDA